MTAKRYESGKKRIVVGNISHQCSDNTESPLVTKPHFKCCCWVKPAFELDFVHAREAL